MSVSGLARTVERWYGAVLRLLPRRFRDEYGDEMARLARARLERAQGRGRWQLFLTSLLVLVDVLRSAVLERISSTQLPRARADGGDPWYLRTLRTLAYSVRVLGRQPLVAITIVLTLTLGTGSTLALFTIAKTAVLNPLPYPKSDELVAIVQSDPKFGQYGFAVPYLPDLRERVESVDPLAGFSPSWSQTLLGAGEPRQVTTAFVSDGAFELFGVKSILGRSFRDSDHQRGSAPVALVSASFWNRQFGGGGSSFSERVIRLDDLSYTIVGVVPTSTRLPITSSSVNDRETVAEIFLPFAHNPYAEERRVPVMNVVGRLRPDVPLGAALSELRGVRETLARDFPDTSGAEVLAVLLEEYVTRDSRRTVWALFGSATFLLLVGCSNVASILMARGTARRSEMAIRSSLGAGRRHLVSQLLAESALLGFAGSAGGLLISWWILRTIPSLALKGLPPSADVGMDASVVLFGIALGAGTSLVFGLVPALRGSRGSDALVLRASSNFHHTGRGRVVLVTAQIALTLLLLAGAGLFARSFWNLLHVDAGFRTEGVIRVPLDMASDTYEASDRQRLLSEVLRRFESFPDVRQVGAVNRLPLSGANVFVEIDVEGIESDPKNPEVVDRRVITEGYFSAIGMHILEGRDVDDRDGVDAQRVCIVNETMARRYWPNGALGRQVRLQLRSGVGPWLRVVGVSSDVRHHGLETPPSPEIYVPYAQASVATMSVVLQASSELDELVPRLREVVWSLDDSMPLDGIAAIESLRQEAVAQPRVRMFLLGSFAGLAALLAALGVYGTTSYSVAGRTREIGLRMALGAERGSVLRLVLSQGLRFAGLGVVIGLVMSSFLAQSLTSLLFEVTPIDLVTFSSVSVLLVGIAAVASYLPARRAARLDPVKVLRAE